MAEETGTTWWESLADIAGAWRKILLALLATAGVLWSGVSWLNTQFDRNREAIAENRAAIQRTLVLVNLTRCAVEQLGPLDCDPYEGMEER